MSSLTKIILFCCVALVVGTLIYRANIAIDPELPKDMPADARFMATGYDLDHNERKGSWVACHSDGYGGSECRVTDAHGMVIFQGAFLPVRDARAWLDRYQTSTSANGKLHWINGPAEGMPVPVIPMTDGSLLVPGDDRDALVDRWNQHPDEWQMLQSAS